jgi:dimethylhistidine N-methyltransferase
LHADDSISRFSNDSVSEFTHWFGMYKPMDSVNHADADVGPEIEVLELQAETNTFEQDVMQGLATRPRSLPSKYFYDEIGSLLFDKICELEEYYLTRTELAIMHQYAAEMAEALGPEVMLVEYGSGSSIKTRILLNSLVDPIAYFPVDISLNHLRKSAENLAREFPLIEVLPVCADFTRAFELPRPSRTPSGAAPTPIAVYFPGSTIGNFHPRASLKLLRQTRELCGRNGHLILGIDLQKSPAIIEAAYNDAKGVTAKFNLNLLQRINRELGADINVDNFRHRAKYNPQAGRVETDIVSRWRQTIIIGEASFDLMADEAIRTEYSYKYTIDGVASMAARAGLKLRRHWTDENSLFAVFHLVAMN